MPQMVAAGVRGLPGERLGLMLSEDGWRLRLTVAETGERLLLPDELRGAQWAEAEARQAAEAEVARLRAELARLR